MVEKWPSADPCVGALGAPWPGQKITFPRCTSEIVPQHMCNDVARHEIRRHGVVGPHGKAGLAESSSSSPYALGAMSAWSFEVRVEMRYDAT